MHTTGLINRCKNGLAGFLLLIISAYCVNSTMFYHQHIVNGEEITHSHFHSDIHTSSSEDGGHTLEVIKLIAVLNYVAIEEQDIASHFEEVARPLECVIGETSVLATSFFVAHYRSLRAPPRVKIA